MSENNRDVLDLKVDVSRFESMSEKEKKELMNKNTEKYMKLIKDSSRNLSYTTVSGQKAEISVKSLVNVVELLKTKEEYSNYLTMLRNVQDQLSEYEKKVLLYSIHTHIILNNGLNKMLKFLAWGIALGFGIPSLLMGSFIGGFLFLTTGAVFGLINKTSYSDKNKIYDFLYEVEDIIGLQYNEDVYFDVYTNEGVMFNSHTKFVDSFKDIKYSRYRQDGGNSNPSYNTLINILNSYKSEMEDIYLDKYSNKISEKEATTKANELNETLEVAKVEVVSDLANLADIFLMRSVDIENKIEDAFVIKENKDLYLENKEYLENLTDDILNIVKEIQNYSGHNEVILNVLMKYDDLLSQLYKIKDLDNDVFVKSVSDLAFKKNMTNLFDSLKKDIEQIKHIVDLEIKVESNEFLSALSTHFEIMNNDVTKMDSEDSYSEKSATEDTSSLKDIYTDYFYDAIIDNSISKKDKLVGTEITDALEVSGLDKELDKETEQLYQHLATPKSVVFEKDLNLNALNSKNTKVDALQVVDELLNEERKKQQNLSKELKEIKKSLEESSVNKATSNESAETISQETEKIVEQERLVETLKLTEPK